MHRLPAKNYPMSAVRRRFFTRLSGRTETCGDLLPSPDKWGPDICRPTRNPFVKLWVKATTVAHTPGYAQPRYTVNYSGFGLNCQEGSANQEGIGKNIRQAETNGLVLRKHVRKSGKRDCNFRGNMR